jgi:DUF1680 family protein
MGPTGNGSVFELWNPAAAVPAELVTELHPYENCVAVGWMQLSAELYALTGDGTYMDEFERTLYNHLLGAQAIDGHDFSYYQGNVGAKVHETGLSWYACCRYRGMTMLTQLGEFLAMAGEESISIALYAPSEADVEVGGVPVHLRQSTDYPRGGEVQLAVDPAAPAAFTLRLRVPAAAPLGGLSVNDHAVEAEVHDGFASILRTWTAGDVVRVMFEPELRQTEAVIGERPAILTTYGPLVLAIDTREGTPLDGTTVNRLTAGDLRAEHPEDWSRIARFAVPGTRAGTGRSILLVDYASAGSLDPGSDRFRVWVSATA